MPPSSRASLRAPAESPWRRALGVARAYWSVAAILVLGSGLTLFATRAIERADERTAQTRLELLADWRVATIEKRLATGLNTISVLAAYFASQQDATREKFSRLTAAANQIGAPLGRLAWEPRVTDAERDAFEAAARAEYPDYGIRELDAGGRLVPARRRPDYFTMRHEAVFGAFPSALGYDITSEADRRARVEEARDAGAPRALQPRRQQVEIQARPSYLVVWPLYRDGSVPDGVAARRAALLGYVTLAAPLADLVAWALADLPAADQDIAVQIGGETADSVVARYDPSTGGVVIGTALREGPGGHVVSRVFDLHGQPWTVRLVFTAAAVERERAMNAGPYRDLGLLLTLLAATNWMTLIRRRHHVERAVAERTSALGRVNARLTGLIGLLPNGVVTVDEAGRIEFASARAEAMFQVPPGSLPGQPIEHFIATHGPAFHDARRAALRGDARPRTLGLDGEIEGRRADGTTVPLELALVGIDTDEGPRALASITDLSEQQAAAEALDSSMRMAARATARLRDALAAFPALFMIYDRDERLVISNGKQLIWDWEVGSSFETLVRRSASVVEHPGMDDDTWSAWCLGEFRRGSADFEVRFTNGRWYRVLFQRISDGGTLYSRIDISDAKLREARLEQMAAENAMLTAAVHATGSGVLITDELEPDGPLRYVNAAFTDITGYPAAEAIGRNCRFLQGPDTDRETVAQIRRAIGARRPVAVEILNYRKDGSSFWNALSLSPVLRPDGRISAYVGIMSDVTERRRLEEESRQAQRLETVGQLSGGLAHDFNNLWGALLGDLEGLAGEPGLPADARERFLHPALHAVRRGAELTHRLLAFSRRQALRPARIEIDALFRNLEPLLHRAIGPQVEVSLARVAAGLACVADPAELENALLNLAINARDAMPEGGVIGLRAEACRIDADGAPDAGLPAGDYVAVAVTDAGIGMAEPVRQRIFDPFYTTKPAGPGTGLGLSMVYGFARQSGGGVTVASAPGRGTTVTLYLPAAAGVAAEPPAMPAVAPAGGTVLLVEDNADLRRVLERHLAGMGLHVIAARDGTEALGVLERTDIALLFTDIMLPGGVSGRDLATAALARRPATKVLFASGFPEAVPPGVDLPGPLLGKPFSRADLVATVGRLLATEPADG